MPSAMLRPVGESFGGWDPSSIFGGGAPLDEPGLSGRDDDDYDGAIDGSGHGEDEATSDYPQDLATHSSADENVGVLHHPTVSVALFDADRIVEDVSGRRGIVDKGLSEPVSLTSRVASSHYDDGHSSPALQPFDSLENSAWQLASTKENRSLNDNGPYGDRNSEDIISDTVGPNASSAPDDSDDISSTAVEETAPQPQGSIMASLAADIDPLDSLEVARNTFEQNSVNLIGSSHAQDEEPPADIVRVRDELLRPTVSDVDEHSVLDANILDEMTLNIQRIYRGHRGRKEANRRMLQAEREKVRIRQSSSSCNNSNSSSSNSRTESSTFLKDGSRDGMIEPARGPATTVSSGSVDSGKGDTQKALKSPDHSRDPLTTSGAPSTEALDDLNRRPLDSLVLASPRPMQESPTRNDDENSDTAESDLEDSLDRSVNDVGAFCEGDNAALSEQKSVASDTTLIDGDSVDMDAETPSSREVMVYKAVRQPSVKLHPHSPVTATIPTKSSEVDKDCVDSSSSSDTILKALQPTPAAVSKLPISSIFSSADDRSKPLLDDKPSNSRLNSARTLDSPFPEEAYIDAGYLNDDIDNFELAALLSKVSPQSEIRSRSELASPLKSDSSKLSENYVSVPTKGVGHSGNTGGEGKIVMYKPNIFDDDGIPSVNSTPRLEIPRHPGTTDTYTTNDIMHTASKGRPVVKTGGFSVTSGAAAPVRNAGVAFSPKTPSVQMSSPKLTSPRPRLLDDGAMKAENPLHPASMQQVTQRHQYSHQQQNGQVAAKAIAGSYAAQAQGSTRERFKIDPNISRRNKACICIQRHARGFLARRRVESYRKRIGRIEQSYCTNCGLKQMGGKYCKKCGRKQDPPRAPQIVYKERSDVVAKPSSLAVNPRSDTGQSPQHNRQGRVEVYQPKQTRVATLWDKRKAPPLEDLDDEDAVEYDPGAWNQREDTEDHYTRLPPKRDTNDRNASDILGAGTFHHDIADQQSSNYARRQPAVVPPPDRGERHRAPRPQLVEMSKALNREPSVSGDVKHHQVPPLPANRDHSQRSQQPPQVRRGVNVPERIVRQKKSVNNDRIAEDIDVLERNLERELEALQLLMDQHSHSSSVVAVKHSGNAKRNQDDASLSVKHEVRQPGAKREGGSAISAPEHSHSKQPGHKLNGAQRTLPQPGVFVPAPVDNLNANIPPVSIVRPSADAHLNLVPQPLSPVKDKRNKSNASAAAKSPSKPAPPPLPIEVMKKQQLLVLQVPAPPPGSAPLLRPSDTASARGGGNGIDAGAARGRRQVNRRNDDPMDSARAESVSLPDIASPRGVGTRPHPLDSRRQQQQQAVRSRKQSTNSAPHALGSEVRAGADGFDEKGVLALPQLHPSAGNHHQQQPPRRSRK